MIDTNPPSTRTIDPLEAIEAAFDWWREAGVDSDFLDETTHWLAAPESEADATSAKVRPAPLAAQEPALTPLQRALDKGLEGPAIGGDRAQWPQTLEKFREWWMTEPSLAEGTLDRRVPPRGVAGARLMVLVPAPFDGDDAELLGGAPGKFLGAILSACGVAPHEAYLASVLPAPTALPDWQALAARGLGEVLRHHIALAAPERVLFFGRAVLPLLDRAGDDARAPFTLAIADRPVPALAAPELADLARAPARRKRFWHNWLEWTR